MPESLVGYSNGVQEALRGNFYKKVLSKYFLASCKPCSVGYAYSLPPYLTPSNNRLYFISMQSGNPSQKAHKPKKLNKRRYGHE